MARRRVSKRNRYKFKSYAFKLTYKQKELVERCAKLTNTTTNKLIKKALKEYLDRYTGMLEQDSWVAENQLSLFRKEDYGEQLSIFHEIDPPDDKE